MRKVLLFILLFQSVLAISQTTITDLASCLDHALKHNPQLKLEEVNQKISREKMRAAWSGLLPQLKAFGNFDNNLNLPVQVVPAQIFGGPEGEYAKLRFGTQYTATYGAEASLNLINVSSWKNVQASAAAQKVSYQQAKEKELSIREQVITAYFFTLLSREAIALQRQLVESGDSLLYAADIRLRNGLVETLEYNRVKAIYLESLQQLKETEASYIKSIHGLKVLLGMSPSDTLVIMERLDLEKAALQSISEINVGVTQLPKYKMLSARTSQLKSELQRSQTKLFPELSMFGRVSRQSFSDELNFNQWFDVSVVGIRAEWVLFSGFQRQSSIRQANHQLTVAQYEQQHYVSQAEKELNDLSVNYNATWHGVQKHREHHELNITNHNIANEKYLQGIYSIDQYVTIYQEAVRSQNMYLNQLANLLVYEAMIQSRNLLNP